MEKSKRSKPHVGVDRLSELPDSVIFHILWFVPMNYVVRTTILSKRWRNLWTTSPFLNFDSSYVFEEDDRDRFRTSVSRALLRWNGVRILKFRVNSRRKLHERIYRDSELYAYFAKEKGVEEFYLHLPFVELDYFDSGNDVYSVPQCLYSCSLLKLLSLRFCNFKIYGNVHWNQLKSLTVTKGFGLTEHVVNQILSGSPKLEVLRLSVVDEGHNLNIRSDSLKELWICKYLLHRECASLVTELIITTPNLETLTIKGIPYGNCRLVDVKSSAHVTLGFYGPDYNENHDCEFKFDPEGSILSQDYIADKFGQVLQTIKHFERVTLFYCCLKVWFLFAIFYGLHLSSSDATVTSRCLKGFEKERVHTSIFN